MTRFLFLNCLFFIVLFIVPLYSQRLHFFKMSFLVFTTAIVVMFIPGIDPLGWGYYVVFGLIVLRSSYFFQGWSLSKTQLLDEELDMAARGLKLENKLLQEIRSKTAELEGRAVELSRFYEKTKEMSKTLDNVGTFYVFASALAENFKYERIKLVLYSDDKARGTDPENIYEATYEEMIGQQDKEAGLASIRSSKSPLREFETKILEEVFLRQRSISIVDPSVDTMAQSLKLWPDFKTFYAHPIFIEKNIFAIVIVLGIEVRDGALLSILFERFNAEMQRLKLYQKVQMLAITDGMTGVYVRRHLMERFEGELERSKRFDFKLSYLMVDIDHFKNINDQYGHLVGDVVLKQVAQIIKKNVRELDLVGRYGGEEFGVLLIETDDSGALYVAERIRAAVEEKDFKAYDENLKVTLSIGCSTLSDKAKDVAFLIETADAALYKAKHEGRNRVCTAGPVPPQRHNKKG